MTGSLLNDTDENYLRYSNLINLFFLTLNRRLLPATIILAITAGQLIAQEFGGNPPSLKWQQIDTDTVKVIFPYSLNKEAQRIANSVMYLSKYARSSIGDKQKKIDIVLQNQTSVSNGYVGLGPFRSEYYMNAPQNAFEVGSNWLDLLTIHEYRHVLQTTNARRGLTSLGNLLTGQLGWSSLMSLSIPNWFLEGDAVVIETALTPQGRGRIPAFYNGYKSLVYSDKVYDYQKARNGSIKDFVPNRYELGFLLCNYGREEYENDFWENILNEAGAYKGLFYPFSEAVRDKTGKSITGFYEQAMNFYEQEWTDSDSIFSIDPNVNIADKKGTVTSYEFPHALDTGGWIVYKESYKKIGGFYYLDPQGNEKLIANQGRVLNRYFTYKDNQLLWAEFGQDARWSWQTYSNIIRYDLKTNKRKKLTHGRRFFSPDLSHDGKKIVVFRYEPDLEYALCIISAEDGRLIRSLPNDQNYFFSYPKWSADDQYILTLARDERGRMGILEVDVADGTYEVLFPFTYNQIGIPTRKENYLYFSGSFTGIDNIFAYDLKDNKLFQVTDGELGSYQVDVSDSILFFSRFSSMGYDLKSKPLRPNNWRAIEVTEPADMPEYQFVAVKEEGGDITNKIPGKEFKTEPYRLFSNALNIHSWSFDFADPNYAWALRSNNILNTLSMNLGIRYNNNEKNFTYFLDGEYSQYYPVFTWSASTGQRKAQFNRRDSEGNIIGSDQIKWWETNLRGGVVVPFDFSSGLYTRKFNPAAIYGYNFINYDSQSEVISPFVKDFNYSSYTTGFTFLNLRKKAKQNIYAKYSQFLLLSYDQAIDENKADQFFVNSEWTFPGIGLNDNLVLQAEFQQEDPQSFPSFGDNFVYARGYNIPLYDNIYMIGTNYNFPLMYPDLGLWGIIYFYRLRANLFFDYSRTYFKENETGIELTRFYNSLGGELIFDTRMFNYYDFSIGLRYSYLLNENPGDEGAKNVFEVFIPLARF